MSLETDVFPTVSVVPAMTVTETLAISVLPETPANTDNLVAPVIATSAPQEAPLAEMPGDKDKDKKDKKDKEKNK